MKTRCAVHLQLGCAPLVLALALGAESAQAQQAAPAAADEIVVTGTRIRQADQPSLEPTVKVDGGYLQDRNLFNLADALREKPGVRGSTTPNGPQSVFGQGANYINLYGLGVNRTLTLIDGRRVVSSSVPSSAASATPGTPVDLNVIPTILIDRTDVLSVGGAPVYGTDAIAGTVNVILKRRMKGLDLEATSGITSEGDNQRLSVQAAGGFDFADGRANLTGAFGWSKVDGVLANERWFYQANAFPLTNPCSTFGAGQVCANPGSPFYIGNYGTPGRTPGTDGRVNSGIGYNNTATDGFPGTVLVANAYFWPLAPGGVVLNPNATALQATAAGLPFNGFPAANVPSLPFGRFDTNGNIVSYNPGTVYPGGRTSGGDGYRPNDYSQITSNLERLNAAAFFTFDASDSLRFFAEGIYAHTVGDQLTAAPLNNAVIQGGANGYLTFSSTNPMLTDQAKQWLAANGYPTNFVLSRTDADIVDLSGKSTMDVYRFVAGVEGKFVLGGHPWNYEATITYGRSDVVDRFQDINQQHFINAINGCSTVSTVRLNGAPTTPIADAACSPLNLFGAGRASAAALAYVQQNVVNRSRLQQTVANVNLGGPVFNLNDNPVSLNLGFEHHVEQGRFTPDAFVQAGRGRSAPVAPTAGSYHMNEEFAEVLVPFVTPSNNSFISKLEVFGRFRNVDNSTNGGFQAWAVGGAFAPVRDIELRGNFTRSFRAPSITELYSLRTVGNFTVPDLCSPSNINAGSAPAVRAANCAAFLAKYPGATPLTAATVSVPGFLGGNPNLRNEVANSFTYGVILRPRFAPRLTLSVDYVNIKITDPITIQTVASVASGCFDNISFNTADPANGNAYCSLIKRTATGQVVSDPANPGVTAGYVNGKRLKMDAIQASLDWSAPLSAFRMPGMVGVGAEVFYLRNRLNDVTGVAPVQSEGLVGDPKFQAQVQLRYENAAWGALTTINYTGTQAIAYTQRSNTQPNDVREIDHFDPYATVDLGLWVKAAERFRLTFTVTNLFNRMGQFYNGYLITGSTNSSVNDALGRRFAISARKSF